MLRAPAIFEEKTRWNFEEAMDGGDHEAKNYASINDHLPKVEELFREEERLGWMQEVPDNVAKEKYGNNLYIAALAVVVEPGKIRVVHDGSNIVLVNHRIRPRDQLRSPGAGELRTILRESRRTTGSSSAWRGI